APGCGPGSRSDHRGAVGLVRALARVAYGGADTARVARAGRVDSQCRARPREAPAREWRQSGGSARPDEPGARQQVPPRAIAGAQSGGNGRARRNARAVPAHLRLSRSGMKPTLEAKLAQLTRRLADLDQLLGAEDAAADLDSFRKLAREHAEITPVVALYREHQAAD